VATSEKMLYIGTSVDLDRKSSGDEMGGLEARWARLNGFAGSKRSGTFQGALIVNRGTCASRAEPRLEYRSDQDRSGSLVEQFLVASAKRGYILQRLSPAPPRVKFSMCPISISELPSEVLEYILLSLSAAEILKMKEVPRKIAYNSVHRLTLYPSQVNHLFLDLVINSQYLQHRIDLFSAGLVDNPNTVYSLGERRARLRKYSDGWKGAESSVRYECPLESRVIAFESLRVSDQNLFSLHSDDSATVSFIRIPSSPKQETVTERRLELPFRFKSQAVRSQDNLLAVVEQGIG